MSGSVLTGVGSVLTSAGTDDGDDGGGLTLAESYALGIAGDPDVDNRLVGDYFDFLIDEDAHLRIEQTAVDDGSGENQHPPLELTRAFTNNAARGLMARYEQHYTGAATDRVGGMQFRHYLADDNTERLFCNVRPTLSDGGVATYFDPSYSSGGLCSFYALDLCGRTDALGEFHTFSGDGNYTQQARIPAGGESGTVLASLLTNATALGGGFLGNGDGVGWWVQENAYYFGRMNWRQTSFGTGPVTRLEFMLANDTAGLVRGMTIYPDRVEIAGGQVPTTFISNEINLAAVAGTTWSLNTPTTPAGKGWLLVNNRWIVTARDGTVTVTANIKLGNNVAHDNFYASINPALTATVKNQWAQVLATAAVAIPDASAGSLVAEMVTPATLGTATVYKCRIYMEMILVDLVP